MYGYIYSSLSRQHKQRATVYFRILNVLLMDIVVLCSAAQLYGRLALPPLMHFLMASTIATKTLLSYLILAAGV